MNALARNALNVYQSTGFDSAVEFSDQHQLVGMLFNALLDSLADARRHLQDRAFSQKSEKVTRSQKILYGLRSTLDFEHGGELARSLDSLYDYCLRRLSSANAENNEAALAEVASLMSEIREAWQLMPTREMPGKQ